MALAKMRPRGVMLSTVSLMLAITQLSTAGNAQPGSVMSSPVNVKQITRIKTERKSAAKKGKLPLPGTPDLTRLEDRLVEQGVRKDASMLIRIFKAESELEVWMSSPDTGRYSLFATYPICFWSGNLGPKLKEGDRQAPEGFYTVDRAQANHSGPRWPRALDIGFPNAFDKVNARTGSAILIHGGCASIGCYALTNPVSDEVRSLSVRALEAGQTYVPIHIFPFRMTEANLESHADSKWSDFWSNLKQGYDIFERTRRAPRVAVCGQNYEFQETGALGSANPGPVIVCPNTETRIAQVSR